jgi:NAD(P)-dependent dehydrogenase (short-subunit alcohol dehydrogenase family)
MRFVVTGANRGIGLELCRQIVARGDDVDAGVRNPDQAQELVRIAQANQPRLRVHQLDVAEGSSARRFAAALAPGAVDVVINNAGVLGKWRRVEDFDSDDALYTFNVNALGAIRVSIALLDRVRASSVKKLVAITSGMGSIGDNSTGGAWAYRMSKAALNMAFKNFALEFVRDGISSAVINPGWVKTDMGGPGANTPVEESAEDILRVIDRLSLEESGSFFDRKGSKFEW